MNQLKTKRKIILVHEIIIEFLNLEDY